MKDEQAHHPHRLLHHLVEVRVIHVRPVLLDRELVLEGLARFDSGLIQAGHAVHPVRKDHAVPMHRGGLRETILDVDAEPVALHRLDGRAGRLSVVAPAVDLQARRELAYDGFGDQMKGLPTVFEPPGKRRSVGRYHRRVLADTLTAAARCEQAAGMYGSGQTGRHAEGAGEEQLPSRDHRIPFLYSFVFICG